MYLKVTTMLFRLGLMLSMLILSACGGSGDGDDSPARINLSGTAAVGAAIANEEVRVVDADGNLSITTTNALGEFSITVNDRPPFMLEALFNGAPLYSFSESGGIANITPMTNLVLHEAFKSGATYVDLEDIFDDFGLSSSTRSLSDVRAAQALLNANISPLLTTNGLPNGYNIFTTQFDADGTGIDAVLDALDIVIDAQDLSNITLSIDGATAFSFDLTLDTSAFNITEGGDDDMPGLNLPSALSGEVFALVYAFEQANSPYENGDMARFTFSSSGLLAIDIDPDQNNGDEISISSFTSVGSEYRWEDNDGGFVYSVSLAGESLNEINVIPLGQSAFVGQFIEQDDVSDIENLSLVTALAGTYTVDSTNSGTHSRGTITIAADGAVDFDTNIQFSQADIGLIFDRTFISEEPRIQINYGVNDDEDAILIFLNPSNTDEVQSIQYRVRNSGIDVAALVSPEGDNGGDQAVIDPTSNWDIFVTGTANGIAVSDLYSTTVTGALVPTADNFEATLRPFVAGIGGIDEGEFTRFSIQYISGSDSEVVIHMSYAFTVTIGNIVSNQSADVTWRYVKQ